MFDFLEGVLLEGDGVTEELLPVLRLGGEREQEAGGGVLAVGDRLAGEERGGEEAVLDGGVAGMAEGQGEGEVVLAVEALLLREGGEDRLLRSNDQAGNNRSGNGSVHAR